MVNETLRSTSCVPKRRLTFRNSIRGSPIFMSETSSCQPRIQRVGDDSQEEVESQNRHERKDECLGGGPADPFGAGPAVEPPLARNDGDRRPEKYRLGHPAEQFERADVVLGMFPVVQ